MKKPIYIFLAVITIVASFAGCTTNAKPSGTPATIPNGYSIGFTISDLGDGFKKLTDGEGQEFLLVPEGKSVPAGYENATTVTVPVKKAVILSVTFATLMRPLGVTNSIVGSGTLEKELYLEELKSAYARGQVTYVGGGNMGAPDFEAIQLLKPDVVFCSTGYPDAVEYYNKMKSAGLTVVVVNDYLETDPLARLEWIKFIGAFYGKTREATGYFNTVESNINEIKQKTMVLSYAPSVLWGSIFMGTVYVSGADSYVAKWISAAGGNYLFSDLKGTSSNTINLEELYARAKPANVFIYASTPPYINSIKEIVDNGPVLADVPLIQQGQVYCLQPWFYQTADKPDEVAKDLAAIFHPNLYPGYTVKHFMLLPEK